MEQYNERGGGEDNHLRRWVWEFEYEHARAPGRTCWNLCETNSFSV